MNRRESLIALIAGAAGGLTEKFFGRRLRDALSSVVSRSQPAKLEMRLGVPTMELVCKEFPAALVASLTGTRNADSFCGYPPGTLHLDGVSGERLDGNKWRCVARFRIVEPKSGHWMIAGQMTPVYRREAFAPLLKAGRRVV